MSSPASALSHVSLGTNRFEKAVAFYDAVLATLGIQRVLDLTEHQAMAYGRAFPEFWIQRPHDGGAAQTANGVHVAFLAESTAQVHAFHAAALAAGGRDNGGPGLRPNYAPDYYAAFAFDPDGHNVEAVTYAGA